MGHLPHDIPDLDVYLQHMMQTTPTNTQRQHATSQAGLHPLAGANLGIRLIEAASANDFERARGLISEEIGFRALTPKGLIRANGADAVIKILENWYPPDNAILAIEPGRVCDREGVRYRVRWRTAEEGSFVFEQQAYYEVAEGRISGIGLVCSGDRPLAENDGSIEPEGELV